MAQQTQDPHVFIQDSGSNDGVNFVVYENVVSGERWVIEGECNRCGACWAGSDVNTIQWTGDPIGGPGAFIDLREDPKLDCPVRPEIKDDIECCTLSGRYL